MEDKHFVVKNTFASIDDVLIKEDTGVFTSYIDSIIFDWRKLSTLTTLIQELIKDQDEKTKKHYLSAAANHLRFILDSLLLGKSHPELKNPKYEALTLSMRLVLKLEVKRFMDYYINKAKEDNKD